MSKPSDRCTVAQNFICGFPTCYAEHISRPAQPGAIADAAARRGCRDDLGGCLRSTIMPIEPCGAAKRQAVGPLQSIIARYRQAREVSCQLAGWCCQAFRIRRHKRETSPLYRCSDYSCWGVL